MDQRRVRSIGLVVIALGCLLWADPTLAAMKMVAVTIPLPPGGQTQPLPGLAYGIGWKVAITAIRYNVTSQEGADPVLSNWTITATSSRPSILKVILMVFLEDEKGKRLGGQTKTLFIKLSEEAQEFTFDMKVKREDWERTKSLRIQADFTIK